MLHSQKSPIRSRPVNEDDHKSPIKQELSDAYIICGHGANHSNNAHVDKTFIVPNKCTVVVLGYVGEITYNIMRFYNKIHQMKEQDINKLKDPVSNYDFLLKNFGAVSLFTPGLTCPNFYYDLLFNIKKEGVDDDDYYGENDFYIKSGVVNVDNVPKAFMKQCYIKDAISHKKNKINFFSDLYNDSEYPTRRAVHEYLSLYKKHKTDITEREYLEDTQGSDLDYRVYAYNEFMNTYKNLNRELFITTQQKLCMELNGVFYNFVCRYVPGVSDVAFVRSSYNKMRLRSPIYLNETQKGTVEYNKNVLHKRIRDNTFKNILSESLMYRKPHIKNTYTKSKYRSIPTIVNMENILRRTHKKVKQPVGEIYKDIVHMIDENNVEPSVLADYLQQMLSTKHISIQGIALVLGKLLKKQKITIDTISVIFSDSTLSEEDKSHIIDLLNKKYITFEEGEYILGLSNTPF